MRSLPVPLIPSADVLAQCVAATTEKDLLTRLQAIIPTLAASAVAYDDNAMAETLDLIPRGNRIGDVSKDELIALYSNHLSATRGVARAVYDQLRNSAPNKKCPLCGIGTVAVLDHHLPKARYPGLAIVPANLVPACHFCNVKKGVRYPKNPGEQTLHPYFDARLLNARWVKATLDPGPPPVLVFTPAPPAIWSATDRKRVQHHFTVCGLAISFTSNANDELSPLKARLAMLDSSGGPTAVRAYLNEEAMSYESRPNSWQLSMYQALATDDWFVNGGFHTIA